MEELELEQGLTYETFRIWRAICEYLFNKHGSNCTISISSSDMIASNVLGSKPFVDFDTTKRDELKKTFGFSLIGFRHFSYRRKGWCLQEFWEEKLWFLEQVIVLDRDASKLRRPWDLAKLTAAYEQDFESQLKEIDSIMSGLENLLECLEDVQDEPEELIRVRVQSVRNVALKAKGKLLTLPTLDLEYKPKPKKKEKKEKAPKSKQVSKPRKLNIDENRGGLRSSLDDFGDYSYF